MKSLFFLGVLLVAPVRANDKVVELVPFSLTEMFDAFVPSFGAYSPIEKIVTSERWSGAIRLVCQQQVSFGSVSERRFAVVLYRVPNAASDAISSTSVRVLTWKEGEKMPQPTELSGKDADALLRKLNATEFFSLPPGMESRDLVPKPGEWNVLAEEYRSGRTVRIMRNVESSAPARALVEAVGCIIASERP